MCGVRSSVVVAVVMMVVVVPECCLRVKPSHLPPSSIPSSYNPADECKHIRLVPPARASAVREAVLSHMCLRAAPHVDIDDTFKQFAVFLLHRDHFDDTPKWHSGDAEDVLDDPYWLVNEVTVLKSTRYKWYVHGLPMWPLPHQALPNTTSPKLPRIKKKKPVDWPNYGLATPIYFASKAWRDQAWNVEEFFRQEHGNSPFKSHDKFHKLAREVVGAVDGDRVESYSEWPFLKFCLPAMVTAMTQRNKGLCPDELYIYQRLTPCHPLEAAHMSCSQAALQARILLTSASCRSTDVIVGYSKEYSESGSSRAL